MKITIDGTQIPAKEGQSILEASLEAGIYIPHLCSHSDLESKGGCRLCSVEIDGMKEAVPSCKTQATDGMNIHINGEKAQEVRRMAMELILATHPADCTGCPKYGKCELQSMYQYMGVSPKGWRTKLRGSANDDRNPLITHQSTRCVRCGRCIRACRDLRGVGVLDYVQTPSGIIAGVVNGQSLEEAGCRFCGACIEVCPTGAIIDEIGLNKEERTYAENVVPCRATCPAHIDIPRYVRYIRQGEFDKATSVVREKVPFPETLGSICNHACESECRRSGLKTELSVCRLKRTAARHDTGVWKQRARKEEPTGKRVAVIGAGPAGLTAAYYLAKKGHAVTVFEKNAKAGGQCRYGIPAYRLPDEVLDREIAIMLEAGFTIETNSPGKIPNCLLNEGFDSVLVATGTDAGIRLPLEGNTLDGVLLNSDFLKEVREGNAQKLGDSVMVLGGGNVAYDCARTARRLGVKNVYVACLESGEKMLATEEEIHEGEEEGIILLSGHSFLRIIGDTAVEGVEVQEVEKFCFDENRKAIIELKENTKRVIPVSQVIFAVGQKPGSTLDMGLDLNRGLYITVNKENRTSVDGVYAAGDVVTGTKSVIEAIAQGRRSAVQMDLYLGGDGEIEEVLLDFEKPSGYLGKADGTLHKKRISANVRSADERVRDFELVEEALSDEEAVEEAGRCLQCDLRLQISKPKLWNEY